MGRRPLPPGTWGRIRTRKLGPKLHEARTRFRGFNGDVTFPSARGESMSAAENALLERLAEMREKKSGGLLADVDFFGKTLDLWDKDIDHQLAHRLLEPGSARTYRSTAENWLRPRLGKLRNHEVDAVAANDLVKDSRDARGVATAKLVKTVGGQVCELAVLHKAMDFNPFRSAQRIKVSKDDALFVGEEIKWMSLAQVHDMVTGLRGYAITKERDSKGRRVGKRALSWAALPDLAQAMLCTGVRIGEAVAITGDCITLNPLDGFVYVDIKAHIVRITGEGLVYKPGRKHHRPPVTVRVPRWSNGLWLRLKLAAGAGPIFAALAGGWLDPNNTISRLNEALNETGYGWVTSHVWRKTVCGLLVDAGLPLTLIADLLGHTVKVLEERYRPRKKIIVEGAEVLEALDPQAQQGPSSRDGPPGDGGADAGEEHSAAGGEP